MRKMDERIGRKYGQQKIERGGEIKTMNGKKSGEEKEKI